MRAFDLAVLLLAGLSLACAAEPRPEAAETHPDSEASQPADDSLAATAVERLWIDVREPKAFAAGHAEGALNLQLTWNQLPDRLPIYVPDRSRPLAIQTADHNQWDAAQAILTELGYQDFVHADPANQVALQLMTAAELRARLATEWQSAGAPQRGLIVLDVRTPKEWQGEVIEGALRIDASRAPEVLPQLDPEREYAVICEGGVRSSQLASLLVARGFERVSNVIDGMWAWRRLDP